MQTDVLWKTAGAAVDLVVVVVKDLVVVAAEGLVVVEDLVVALAAVHLAPCDSAGDLAEDSAAGDLAEDLVEDLPEDFAEDPHGG